MSSTNQLSAQLQELLNQYNNMGSYKAKTQDELRAQAEGEYASYYDQLRLSAKQSKEQSDLRLTQQLAGLASGYDKQREASAKEYAKAYSQTDRHMLSRGMQRSSYTAQTLANLQSEGAEAQQAINDQQAAAEANIEDQRTQLAQQLAQQLSQYDANEAADVLNRLRELEDQEYDRSQQHDQIKNSLSAQIYQFMYQAERDKVADEQWAAQMAYQKERDAVADAQWQQQYGSKKSGSGGSSGSSGRDSSGSGTGDPGLTMSGLPSFSDLMAGLSDSVSDWLGTSTSTSTGKVKTPAATSTSTSTGKVNSLGAPKNISKKPTAGVNGKMKQTVK